MEESPYARPANPLSTTYYTTEPRNATLRELWRITPPTLGGKLVAVLVKVLRLDAPPQSGFALGNAFRSTPEETPWLLDRFEATIDELASLGFRPVFTMSMPVLGNVSGYSLAFLGEDPTVCALIVHSELQEGESNNGQSGLSFLSRDATTIWATSGMRRMLNSPPMFKTTHLPDALPKDLLAAHNARIAPLACPTLRQFTVDVLWETLREHEALSRDFNLMRGVFRKMTAEEVKTLSGGADSRL